MAISLTEIISSSQNCGVRRQFKVVKPCQTAAAVDLHGKAKMLVGSRSLQLAWAKELIEAEKETTIREYLPFIERAIPNPLCSTCTAASSSS
jgi:hypothetical protein